MKRINKQKRDQLILVSVVILIVLVGLWFLLIRAQKDGLTALRAEKATKETKETQMREKINTGKNVETELSKVAGKLSEKEEDMVSGDPYASLVNTIRKFKLRYKLDIPQFSPAASVTDVDLLPKFPYKQIKISISGTGYYEEIGKFVADFENEYSASRVLNLELTPYSAPGTESKEKLTFRMDIVALVASGAAAPANSR
jgi:Tfp pilus assembly protein PilO